MGVCERAHLKCAVEALHFGNSGGGLAREGSAVPTPPQPVECLIVFFDRHSGAASRTTEVVRLYSLALYVRGICRLSSDATIDSIGGIRPRRTEQRAGKASAFRRIDNTSSVLVSFMSWRNYWAVSAGFLRMCHSGRCRFRSEFRSSLLSSANLPSPCHVRTVTPFSPPI